MKKLAQKTGGIIRRNGKFLLVAGLMCAGTLASQAQVSDTTAESIATDANTAFGVIAPITVTIAGFYVILKIAKRVVH